MDLIENLSFNLITPNGSFDLNACLDVFGYSFGRDNLNHITLISSLIFIGWWPQTSKASIVVAVYEFLNSSNIGAFVWNGWLEIKSGSSC